MKIQSVLALILACNFLSFNAYAQPKEIGWQDLVPLGWPDRDPLDGRDISSLNDDDPEAVRLYALLRNYLDNAPVVRSLHDQYVTIPGFAVPLNFHPDSREIRQFLLVPFYGACIHVPPPASNQIILVDAGYVSGEIPQQKDVPIEVTGRLIVDHAESDLAVSSYRINATRIVPYH